MGFLQALPPLLVVAILAVACFIFYTQYVSKAKMLATTLSWINETVITIKSGSAENRKSGLAKVFQDTILEENWAEFSRTLHEQITIGKDGEQLIRHRATIPAHHFFTASTIIDKPLKVAYFKHLPGILTGIGIIGTFSGLLFGLSYFDVSSPEVINESVSLLLAGVRDAFVASAIAITAAMLVTHIEKWLYQRCLTNLECLNESISRMFEAGISEEYLAKIAEHSTGLSGHADSVKDAMSEVFLPMARKMQEMQAESVNALSETFAEVLKTSNGRLASQIELALQRQVKYPIENLATRLSRGDQASETQDISKLKKIIRSSQSLEGNRANDSSKVA